MAAYNLMPVSLTDFDLILAGELKSGLYGLRATAGEVHGAVAEVVAGEGKQFLCVFLGDGSGELAGVDELKLRGLLGHSGRNLRHTMSDEINGCRTSQVQITIAVGVPQVHSLSADGGGKFLAERAAQNRRTRAQGGEFIHCRIIASHLSPVSDSSSRGSSKEMELRFKLVSRSARSLSII